MCIHFLDPEDGSPNATLVVVVVVLLLLLLVVINSLKIPKAFLICSGTTKLCIHISAHVPYRSTVSDF